MAAHKFDELAVPRAPSGNERPVRQLGAVVDQRPPRKGGQRAAGFVHQKVRRRKVPIVAVAGNLKL